MSQFRPYSWRWGGEGEDVGGGEVGDGEAREREREIIGILGCENGNGKIKNLTKSI
jgi:hypothetical protein